MFKSGTAEKPRHSSSSAASDVYRRRVQELHYFFLTREVSQVVQELVQELNYFFLTREVYQVIQELNYFLLYE